jgi:hypothetical protein
MTKFQEELNQAILNWNETTNSVDMHGNIEAWQHLEKLIERVVDRKVLELACEPHGLENPDRYIELVQKYPDAKDMFEIENLEK